jgi:DHA2 family multidrug resistance protein
VQGQAVVLSTNETFMVVMALFAVSALIIWLAPKPRGRIQASGGH